MFHKNNAVNFMFNKLRQLQKSNVLHIIKSH